MACHRLSSLNEDKSKIESLCFESRWDLESSHGLDFESVSQLDFVVTYLAMLCPSPTLKLTAALRRGRRCWSGVEDMDDIFHAYLLV